jgi:hypothetical protein
MKPLNQKCVCCLEEASDVYGGFCGLCALPAMIHAEGRMKWRIANPTRQSRGCLFCDSPVMVEAVVLFSAYCHWRCYATWVAAHYREKEERVATKVARMSA